MHAGKDLASPESLLYVKLLVALAYLRRFLVQIDGQRASGLDEQQGYQILDLISSPRLFGKRRIKILIPPNPGY